MRACHLLGALLLACTGCASLRLTPLKAVEQKPSNVAVFFTARTASGDPVEGLTADDLRVYEDGRPVPRDVSKLTILRPDAAVLRATLLLVDMSAGVTESGEDDVVPQAVSAFALRVASQQKVAVYAFDGSPDPFPIVPFADQARSARAGARQLAAFKPKDPSSNLNGAIVRALDDLQAALAESGQPLQFGTLVVFAAGPDRANRVSAEDMLRRIRQTPFDVFAIGMGPNAQTTDLSRIGKTGVSLAPDKDGILKAFDDVGVTIEARSRSVYLLSYCSPSRAGKHEVRVEATLKGAGDADRERTGSFWSSFDATDFAPGCDPTAPPRFAAASAADAGAPGAAHPSADQRGGEKAAGRRDRRESKSQGRGSSSPPVKRRATPAAAEPVQDFNP